MKEKAGLIIVGVAVGLLLIPIGSVFWGPPVKPPTIILPDQLPVEVQEMARKLDEMTARINTIEILLKVEVDKQRCPVEYHAKKFVHSIWREDVRGVGTGILTCFYKG